MKSLADFTSFLNEQTEYHQRQIARHHSDSNKKQRHEKIAQKFRDLAEIIKAELNNQHNSSNNPVNPPTALTPADLDGLPKELLEQLNITKSDTQDIQIINLINSAGGVMSLDKLLIALYRHSGEVHLRPKLTARLYRMVQKGLIFTVPKKKGLYTTKEPATKK